MAPHVIVRRALAPGLLLFAGNSWAGQQQRSRDDPEGRGSSNFRRSNGFLGSNQLEASLPPDDNGVLRGVAGTASAPLAVAAAAAAGGGQGGGFRPDGCAVAFVPPPDWPAGDAPAPPLLYNRVDLDGRRSSATEEELEASSVVAESPTKRMKQMEPMEQMEQMSQLVRGHSVDIDTENGDGGGRDQQQASAVGGNPGRSDVGG